MRAHDAAHQLGTGAGRIIEGNATTLPLSGHRCECGACHQRFNSLSAFDLHRTGAHGVDRHCRESGELLAIGMSRNAAGFWIERWRGEARQKRRPRAQETRSALALAHGAGKLCEVRR